MKAVAFEYQAPTTLDAACAALLEHAEGGKVMGGSQSMGPMLNMRLVRPGHVVDVSRVAELRTVQADQRTVTIGAAITHAEIEDGVYPELRSTMMQGVARGIAYRAVRTRGTLGGSLAHADPAADWVVVCTALGAKLRLVSARGSRVVAMDDFMFGAYTTAIEEGEVIASVTIPRATESARWAYQKFCRKTGEFAEASCAAWFDPQLKLGRIVLGALDGPPRVLRDLTIAFASKGPSLLDSPDYDAQLQAAVAGAAPDRDAVDQRLLATVVTRCLRQLAVEAPR